MLFHNPVMLARRFARLDVPSEGRAIAGLGIGWSKEEDEISGIPFKNRGKRSDEYIQILRKMWTEDVVEFKGQFYNIPASKISPKPIQNLHIPIYLGGYSQGTFARIANCANGWICVIRNSLDHVKSHIVKIRNECYKAKRDPKDVHIAAILYPIVTDSNYTVDKEEHNTNDGKPKQRPLLREVSMIGKDLQELKKAGVNHAIFNYDRSSINSNNIDNIIDISKQFSAFLK